MRCQGWAHFVVKDGGMTRLMCRIGTMWQSIGLARVPKVLSSISGKGMILVCPVWI